MTDNLKRRAILDLALFGFACLALIVLLLVRGSLYPGAPAPAHTHPRMVSTAYSTSQGWPKWQCHFAGNTHCGLSPACSWVHGRDTYDQILRSICQANIQAGAHWRRVGAYDGHRGCWILVGGTSLFKCGKWLETS